MQQYFDTLTDDSGNALLGATVQVLNWPALTNATIYSSNGTVTPIANNTVTSDVTGQISFYAPDGAYELVYAYNATTYKTRAPVQLLDPMSFVSVSDTGAVNTYVVTDQRYPTQLYSGLKIEVKIATTNTGGSTLNLNSSGNQPITLPGGSALSAGQLQANGLARFEWDGTEWQFFAVQSSPNYPQTTPEANAGIVPANTSYPTGSVYRYGVKGGAVRMNDVIVTAGSAILTSPSGGFATAVAGMVIAVVEAGALRTGGRAATLVTTIFSVQSSTQVTMATTAITGSTISLTGTLNGTTTVSALSKNPITQGVGLTRIWAVTGTNIASNTSIAQTTSSTMLLTIAATGSGTAVALTLVGPMQVCFGYDDHIGLNEALSLPYALPNISDNILTTLPVYLGGTATGCCKFEMIGASILMVVQSSNTNAAITLAGYDRTTSNFNGSMTNGMRYVPYWGSIGEIDACNTGLDGVYPQPSTFSYFKARITNAYRSGLCEWFTANDSWQEGNIFDINVGFCGLHFHHKVNLGNVYQNLAAYRIQGRCCGLNSVYLGIPATGTTNIQQLGGGVRVYAGGNSSIADSGINQNNWGMIASCEMDCERQFALSYGSDVCNSPYTFADASQSYVIEGTAPANYSNQYNTNLIGGMAIEDVTSTSDTRGGYQYFAMSNTNVSGTTLLSPAGGPWGQTNLAPQWYESQDVFTRWVGDLIYSGNWVVASPSAGSSDFQLQNNSSFSLAQGGVIAVSTGGTIGTANLGTVPCTVAAAATGVILQAGTQGGQTCVIFNESSTNLITMAAAGTSHVADGTSCNIPALTQKTFVWNASASLWYHS